MSGRLLAELAVVAAVGGFAYVKMAPRWRGWSQPLAPAETAPAALPGEDGRAVALGMERARIGKPDAPKGGLLVKPEPRPFGPKKPILEDAETPRVRGEQARQFERRPISDEAVALVKERPAAEGPLTWLERLRRLPGGALAGGIFGVFVILYLIGVRALRSYGVDKPLTHD